MRRLFVCSALLLGACASTPKSGAEKRGADARTVLPTNEQLAEVARAPLPDLGQVFDAAEVDSWTLEGPFPDPAPAPHAARSKWESLLEKLAGGSPATPESMHCAARELGRFFLAHDKMPPQRLRERIAQRCSAYLPLPTFAYLAGEVSPSATDDQVFDRWSSGLGPQIDRLRPNAEVYGVWYGKKGDRAVVMIAAGKLDAVMDGVARRENVFRISGTFKGSVDRARAIIGAGKLGVSECTRSASVALPRFTFECSADPGDQSSIIEIIRGRPGEILERVTTRILVSAQGEPPATWSVEKIEGDRPPASGAELSSAFLTKLNELRAGGGLAPLLHEPAQSEIAERVSPHFFAAEFGLVDRCQAELIVLGLSAGWSVGGMIDSGSFGSVAGTLEGAATMAATVLEYPWTREILLRPDAVRIAIGPTVLPQENFGGMVLTTYTELAPLPETALREAFLAEVNQARAKIGLGPAQLIPGVEQKTAELRAKIEAPGSDPEELAGELVQAALDARAKYHGFGRFQIQGFLLETPAMNDLPLPDELLRAPSLHLAVAFGVIRGGHHPWARYLVLIAFEKTEGQETASL